MRRGSCAVSSCGGASYGLLACAAQLCEDHGSSLVAADARCVQASSFSLLHRGPCHLHMKRCPYAAMFCASMTASEQKRSCSRGMHARTTTSTFSNLASTVLTRFLTCSSLVTSHGTAGHRTAGRSVLSAISISNTIHRSVTSVNATATRGLCPSPSRTTMRATREGPSCISLPGYTNVRCHNTFKLLV